MIKYIGQVIILLSLTLIVSCKEKKKPLSFEEFRARTEAIMNDVKSPGDIAAVLSLSAAEFQPGLVNAPGNFKYYIEDTLEAAANMGIYLVDATYQYTYHDGDGAYKSYAAARKLSEVLGIQDILWEITFKRETEGLSSEDSVLLRLEEVLSNAENAFSALDRQRIYTVIIAGNYIEKLYLLMNILLRGNEDLPDEVRLSVSRQIIIAIRTQLSKIDDLISLIERYKKKEDSGYILDRLQDINQAREKFYKAEDISKLTPDVIYNNPVVNDLFSNVKSARDYITTTKF